MEWKKRKEMKGSLKEQIKEVFLRNIGASSLEEVNGWFSRTYADGWRIDRLDEAVELALRFKNLPVRIIGDYDVDGMTATSILLLALKRCGFTNVSYRIPKRFSEGFGINETIIDEVNAGLVITCDNGVAQVNAINKAKAKGLTVIVIDHHMPLVEEGAAILPDADIIIDPNAIPGSADFSGYCGAGLSYRFAKKMLEVCDMKSFHTCLIGLAALGTVADVMELRQENYVIVKNGMKCLLIPDCCTQGLKTLLQATAGSHITATDIGFKIGPVMNSASRLNDDGAKDVVNLLVFNGDYPTAVRMTQRLVDLNTKRKGYKYEALRKAEEYIKTECLYGNAPLIIRADGTPEGILGIVAGNLCEKYNVPTIVLAKVAPGVLKGSARSCNEVNIKDELDKVAAVSESLIRYGGHEGAAGLSVKEELFFEFCDLMSQGLESYVFPTMDSVEFDISISAAEAGEAIDELEKYEPWGNGCEKPVFLLRDFETMPYLGKYYSNMGDGGSIVKVNGRGVDALGFEMKERFEGFKALRVDFIGTLSRNLFNGKSSNQIEFSDFNEKAINIRETDLALKLKAMAAH